MAKEKVAFLQLFSAWRPQGELLELAQKSRVLSAKIDREARALRAQVECPASVTPAQLSAWQEGLKGAYRMSRVELELLPSPGEAPPPGAAVPPTPPAPQESAPGGEDDPFRRTEALRREALRELRLNTPAPGGEKKARRVLLGSHEVKKPPVPIGELELDMGSVVVEGDVFAVNHKELKKRGAWIAGFDLTDYTGSIHVSSFIKEGEDATLIREIRPGMRLLIQGKLNLDRFAGGEMVLQPTAVTVGEKPVRRDTAREKRVELHLHTVMSAMDALTPAAEAVRRAESWGHRAIAITDHGVAQSFPDAWGAGKKIKVLYGVEAYFDNDVDARLAVHGVTSQSFDREIVCFDIETTGLDKKRDRIIEIGAVVLRDGELRESFNTFVSPGRPISPQTVELTGITEGMLRGAPEEAEAVSAFLDFAAGRPLAAHNAEFDTGFISEACARMGRPFQNPWIDTLVMAQRLLPELSRHKLDTVAEHLHLPAFRHHRASDDAGMVGYMLLPFFRMLSQRGASHLGEIDAALAAGSGGGKSKRRPKHLIVLAKNQLGLRSLYRLVSDSHLKFFHRKPIIPKSELNKYREGLILGSACSAGELYEAVSKGKDWEELKRIASWYDYLEIQPLCNNAFMLRSDKKTGKPMVESEEELREFNRTIVRLGKELDKPVCATGDVHFLDPEQELYRRILLDSQNYEDCDYPLPIYFKTTDEMLQEFSYLGEEDCYNTVIRYPNLVADWCDAIDPLPKGLFAPKLKDSDKELESLVYAKAHELYGEELPKVVQDRIDLELPGIIKRKYDVIYMSAQKLVQNSLEHGYLVGSRGSVGSSIVAFLSGITEVNSLPAHYRCPNCKHADFDFGPAHGYGCGADMPDAVCPVCGTPYVKDGFDIPFETFLGFGGDKVPDIDLNFSGEYQAKAHRYTFELFGENHVFRAGTIGTVAEKTAYVYVKKYLEKRDLHVSRAEENRLALGCTGVKRTTGQHPGGMVVIPQDREIWDFCPVQHPADKEEADTVTTHFDYHKMEANLLKLDMLGHDDPTMIRMLEDLTGVDARRDIRLDDPDTMSLFTTSERLGYENDPILGPTGAVAIPEFNTKFTRQMLMDTNPQDFNTLVRLSGFSHGTDVWLGNARDLIVGGVASVLETVGCRDDIMLYLIKMGLEPKMSFKIMEAVRKGKVKQKGFDKLDPSWVKEMKAHAVPDWYIESLAKIGYLFPKAHAVAYVMMAYRIAWFKVHRPLAFYAAFFSIRAKAIDATCMCMGMDVALSKLREIARKMAENQATSVEEDMYTTLEVIYEFYLRGFSFSSMDLYRSDPARFLPDGESSLLPPFASIPGLGEAAAASIAEQRQGRQFISAEELSAACPKVSQTHIKLLREVGALGDLPDTSQLTFF